MTQSAATSSEDHWTPFDAVDVALIVQGLDALDPSVLMPEVRSRLIELRELFTQRETAYYGD